MVREIGYRGEKILCKVAELRFERSKPRLSLLLEILSNISHESQNQSYQEDIVLSYLFDILGYDLLLDEMHHPL